MISIEPREYYTINEKNESVKKRIKLKVPEKINI